MTTERQGDWIQTFTGRRFYPLDPRPEEIDIDDVSHALSNLCRFTGHVKTFYSVGQHSILVSLRCPPEDALWGLLHDASEAYLCDVARPVKRDPRFSFYREAETLLMANVCERFGLPMVEPKTVRTADAQMLMTERRDLMTTTLSWEECKTGPEPYEEIVVPRSPWEVRAAFLARFYELTLPSAVRGSWCFHCGLPMRSGGNRPCSGCAMVVGGGK